MTSRKTAKNVHANATAGTVMARALPRSSSPFETGVERTGSSVPWCRSPTTLNASRGVGRMVGMMKNSSWAWPTTAL